jgi:uncharacterized OsmC-like protein
VADPKPHADPSLRRSELGDLGGLKDLYERKARVMANRPELARQSGHVHVRLTEGLACAVDGAEATSPLGLFADDDGPRDDHRSPEQLMRASLAASLALGYRLWSARLEIAVEGIEVELHTDDDARGQLLLETDVAPGWQRIHVVVTMISDAPAADVQRVVDCSNRHCLVLATLSRDIEQVHQLRVLPTRRGSTPPPAGTAQP